MWYHGSTDALGIGHVLLPPDTTGKCQEKGRVKNTDRVFFTLDLGSAKIYAGRACARFGGNPVIYRVIPMGDIVCLNDTPGTTVFHCGWAFVEQIGSL